MVETTNFSVSQAGNKRENLLDVVLTSLQQQGKVSGAFTLRQTKSLNRLVPSCMQAVIFSRIILVVKHSRREQGFDGARGEKEMPCLNSASADVSILQQPSYKRQLRSQISPLVKSVVS